MCVNSINNWAIPVTHKYIYIYIYICVCVCVCIFEIIIKINNWEILEPFISICSTYMLTYNTNNYKWRTLPYNNMTSLHYIA